MFVFIDFSIPPACEAVLVRRVFLEPNLLHGNVCEGIPCNSKSLPSNSFACKRLYLKFMIIITIIIVILEVNQQL